MSATTESQGEALGARLQEEFADPSAGAQRLKAIASFKRFALDELKKIYTLGEVKLFRPQTYVVIEGEPSRGLFVILKGSLSVYKTNPSTGNMHRIAMLETNHNFGEFSLFDEGPRTATVSAESTCHLFHLPADKFENYLDNAGGDIKTRFYRAFAEDLVTRFRILNADYITAQQQLWRFAFKKEEEVVDKK